MSSRRPRRASESPKVYGPVRAYHWLAKPDELRDGEPTCVGKTHILPQGKEPVLCYCGFHASANFEASLSYAPGFYLTRVELSGRIYGTASDKYVASRRRMLWRVDVRPLLIPFAKPYLEAALAKLSDIFPTVPPEFAQALAQLEADYAAGASPSNTTEKPAYLQALYDVKLTDKAGKTALPREWAEAVRYISALDELARCGRLRNVLWSLSWLAPTMTTSVLIAAFEALVLEHAPEEPPLTPSKRRWTPEMGLRRRKLPRTAVAKSLQPQSALPLLAKRIIAQMRLYEQRRYQNELAQTALDGAREARAAASRAVTGWSYYSSPSFQSVAEIEAFARKVRKQATTLKKQLPQLLCAIEQAEAEKVRTQAHLDKVRERWMALHAQVMALPVRQRTALREQVYTLAQQLKHGEVNRHFLSGLFVA